MRMNNLLKQDQIDTSPLREKISAGLHAAARRRSSSSCWRLGIDVVERALPAGQTVHRFGAFHDRKASGGSREQGHPRRT